MEEEGAAEEEKVEPVLAMESIILVVSVAGIIGFGVPLGSIGNGFDFCFCFTILISQTHPLVFFLK